MKDKDKLINELLEQGLTIGEALTILIATIWDMLGGKSK